ncbi:MAG: aldo/keto reductase [Alphaproteobacteria bacterium]|nr:aldo/keto reductase [Alphaproteobacteria bacterium]
MKYVNLGTTGLKVSKICLGCMTYGSKKWRPWVLEDAESQPLLRKAIDQGINFFDTSNSYSIGVSEEILGRAIKAYGPREKVVIATKVWGQMSSDANDRGLSRKNIMQSIDASLKRLQMDYVDLYQIHRFDPRTPLEETLDALNDVVRAGKVLYIGASSMHAWQFMKALSIQDRRGYARFVTMQNHYNLLYREEENEMIPLCREEGVGLIPWSPLARGLLAGNLAAGTTRSQTDDLSRQWFKPELDQPVLDAVGEVARAHNTTPAQVALAWIMTKSPVSAPIIGASKSGHLDDAAGAIEIALSADDIKKLEAPYRAHPLTGHN